MWLSPITRIASPANNAFITDQPPGNNVSIRRASGRSAPPFWPATSKSALTPAGNPRRGFPLSDLAPALHLDDGIGDVRPPFAIAARSQMRPVGGRPLAGAGECGRVDETTWRHILREEIRHLLHARFGL